MSTIDFAVIEALKDCPRMQKPPGKKVICTRPEVTCGCERTKDRKDGVDVFCCGYEELRGKYFGS